MNPGVRIPSYNSMWIYIVGPLIGGILAAIWSKVDEVALEKAKTNNNVSDASMEKRLNVQEF